MTGRENGFTLLELLLATALLALVMGMLATALGASLRVAEALRVEDEVERQAQTTLRRLGEDLGNAYAEPALPFRAGQGTAQRLDNDMTDDLVFASMAHLVFAPEEAYRGPALIAYRVEAEEAGKGRLKLLRSDVPLLLAQANDAAAVEAGFFLLAEGLRAVHFAPLDERGEPWQYWVRTGADGAVEVALPAAVRIRLEFWLDVDSGESRAYETTVLMPAGLIRAPSRTLVGRGG